MSCHRFQFLNFPRQHACDISHKETFEIEIHSKQSLCVVLMYSTELYDLRFSIILEIIHIYNGIIRESVPEKVSELISYNNYAQFVQIARVQLLAIFLK